MKLKDVIKTVGGPLAQVAASMIPGGPAILAAVNAVLPDGEKLRESSTGSEIARAIESLPDDKRASLLEKRIDLQIAQEEGWTERYVAMAKADGQSTRPKIALMMAWATVLSIGVFVAAVGWQIFTSGLGSLAEASAAWTVLAAPLAIPSGVLAKYFGELRREQGQRLGKVGVVDQLLKMI